MITADSLYRYMHEGWGIPLLAVGPGDAVVGQEPAEVARIALEMGDGRLLRVLPLWLSLLDDVAAAPPELGEHDRRRLAYLCDLAARLAALRNGLVPVHDPEWPERVAGISPRQWADSIPLVPRNDLSVAPSGPGTRWGVGEPLDFTEYVAFQNQYLTVRANVCKATTPTDSGMISSR